MTNRKNAPGAGRPKSPPGTTRHNVFLPPDVWAALGKKPSQKIIELVRAAQAQAK